MIPTSVRIFLALEPQDMRRGFDRLAVKARELTGIDPLCGGLYVFVNKRRTRAKVLWWDTSGYCILYKRLHRALYSITSPAWCTRAAMNIRSDELLLLLKGVAREKNKKIS